MQRRNPTRARRASAPHRTQQQKARNSDRERQAAPAGKRRSIISGATGRRRKRQPSLEQNRQRRRLRLAQSANHPPPSAATHRATNALPPLCVVRSARLPGAGARSTYTRCCSTRRGSAAVRATRQCCLRCFRLPSPPAAFGSPPLRPAPARLALPVRKQPSRPRQCERTAQTHEQFPCEYEPLRESRPSLEYTTRQAAACRFRPRREHLPLISTTALGLSAATHSLSLLQSLGSPPTPLSFIH